MGLTKVHVGIVTYSGSALTLEIDQLVSKEVLEDFTNQLTQQGRQINVVSALDEAFRSTFSIFGGVRQSKPKSFVLLVPEGSVSSRQEVLNAAARLKSLGVRLLTVGIGGSIDQNLYELASTQPPSKFFYDVPNHNDLNAKSRDVAEVICKGNLCGEECSAFRTWLSFWEKFSPKVIVRFSSELLFSPDLVPNLMFLCSYEIQSYICTAE